MRLYLNISVLIPVYLAFAANQAVAQNFDGSPASADENARFRITRAEEPPVIDGRLLPGEWDGAAQVSNLYQVSPLEFSSPAEETYFYWTYDDKAIYVGAFAHDADIDAMSAYVLNQGGDLENEDSLTVLINPFDNNRTAYQFSLNANGVRSDGLFNGTRLSNDWEGIWQGAATRHEDGWSAEWSIPFSTLTFDPSNSEWRVNMKRNIPRYNQEIGWRSINGAVNPNAMGIMSGIEDVSQGMGIDLIPSFSAIAARDHQTGNQSGEINPSLDINYKLTSSLNLGVTLNTDFAGTELDGRQLNLDRFNPSLPEKRSFFLTDFDIFEFGASGDFGGASNGTPFFSRRIGLSSGQGEVDIIGGVKLSGRVNSYDLGALYIRQDEYAGVEATDLMIARLSRTVFSESDIGLIFTSGDPSSNDSSSTYGIDYNYVNSSFFGGRQLNFSTWYQKSQNPGLDESDSAWRFEMELPASQGWVFDASITEIEENFDPRLGFVNRAGVRSYSSRVDYIRNLENAGLLQQVAMNFQFEKFDYLDNGEIQSQQIQFRPFRIQTHAGDVMAFMLKHYTENLRPGDTPFRRLGTNIPVDRYEFFRPRMYARTSRARALSAESSIEWGDFYTGSRLDLSGLVRWQANRNFSAVLDVGYNKYEFSDVTAEVTQVEVGADYAFNSAWSFSNTVQYDTLSRNVALNMRLRWNLQSGRDVWFVVDHSMEDINDDGRFVNLETSATFKVRYTYRY